MKTRAERPLTDFCYFEKAERGVPTHDPATIRNGEGHVVGVAMHTPPHHLFVSRMPAAAHSRWLTL